MQTVRNRISAEARGRLRLFRCTLEREAGAIEDAARRIPAALVSDVGRAFGRRADSAMETIVRQVPVAPMVRERRSAVWRYLRPIGTASRPQVQVACLLLNTSGAGLAITSFGLCANEHALGRLLDRTQFRADPAAALIEAHDALAGFEVAEGERLLALPAFNLPAANGMFLFRSNHGVGDADAMARTWIDRDQFFREQEAHAAAWSRFTTDAAMSA